MNFRFIILLSAMLLFVSLKSDSNLAIYKLFPVDKYMPERFSNPEYSVDISDLGATPNDGKRDDKYIEQAVISCHRNGGGKIIVPEGKFFTGPIKLKSNITLHIKQGGELFFSNKKEDYLPVKFTRWEGIECYNYSPLVYIKDAKNVIIEGEGKINGNGKNWWKDASKQLQTLEVLYDMVLKDVPVEKRVLASEGKESFLRPSLIQFINCENIIVKNVEITSGPMWTTHFIYCKNLVVEGIKVNTVGRNNDGITPDACENVYINNCEFSTGDDCIVIKSGLNEDGWRVGVPSKNIFIENCTTYNGHGGVVIGSEMSAGVENVYVRNCDFNNTETGIRIKTMKGRGGYIKNVFINNITMSNIELDAIKTTLNYRSSSIEPEGDSLPEVKDIYISNVKCNNAGYAISVKGLPNKKVSNLNIRNIDIQAENGVVIRDAKDCSFINLIIKTKSPDVTAFYNCESTEIR